MKKFTTLLTMAFIALMSISFTSCDDDDYWYDDYYWYDDSLLSRLEIVGSEKARI